MIRNKKVFGKKNESKQAQSQKWIDGIGQQLEYAAENLNVKFIPIEQVSLDPDNARKIVLSRKEIENGPKLENKEFDEQHQNEFLQKLQNYFNDNKENKINEYFELAFLAASIKSRNNLINPITVFSKDMSFHLISGHRRTLAHIILGESKIYARILEKTPDQLEHSLIQWKENKDRQDLTLFDEITNVQRIIQSWENINQDTISIRKLMSLLNTKKTKASYYLAIIREIAKNTLLFDAIKMQCITSLEVLYNLCNMQDVAAKSKLLKEILSGTKYHYQQLMSKIKSPDLTVRSPDTLKFKNSPLIKITKRTNLDVVAKLTRIMVKSPEFKSHQDEFEQINLKSKSGLTAAWQKIYEILNV